MSDVLAFVFEADYHCPECAAKRFPACVAHGEVACPVCYRDREGNPPGATMSWDSHPNGCYCGDCLRELREPDEDYCGRHQQYRPCPECLKEDQ